MTYIPFITTTDVEELVAFYLRRSIDRYGGDLSSFRSGTSHEEALQWLVDEVCEHVSDALATLSQERLEDEFVAGWREAGGYVADLEAGCPTPWCAPWTYQGWVWENELAEGLTPRERGAQYWAEHRDEVMRLAEEEALDREAEEAEEDAS